ATELGCLPATAAASRRYGRMPGMESAGRGAVSCRRRGMRRTPPEAAAFLAALEETQYLAPRRLKAYQRRLLEILLRHARAETDFYRERLRPLFRTDGSIDWEGWEEVPILGRRDVQEHFSALV